MKCFAGESRNKNGMVGETSYKLYYNECLSIGQEFQDFAALVLLKERGIVVTALGTKKYQYSIGENMQGIEIKFDQKTIKTGNMYIEVSEKSDPNNEHYASSGIYRNDNTWLYLIGNYSIMYIFSKKLLQLMYEKDRYRKVETPTSRGFLIPVSDAKKYSALTIDGDSLKKYRL